MPRKATSQDVADLAGVSRSAVSMVLNGRGNGNIAAEKQVAIRAAAERLNYSPNPAAVSLRSRRTRTLGMVTDAIASSAYGGQLLQGASERAARAGHLLVLIDTHYDQQRETDAWTTLRDRRVDGLFFAAMSLREYTPPPAAVAAPENPPLVLANCFDPTSPATPAFLADEVGGGRTAAELLLAEGHRDLVLLAGDRHDIAAGLREQGAREAVATAGLPPLETVVAGWEIDKGFAAATAVLRRPRRPTGLLCANDRVAVGAVLAAGRSGLSVPGDVSVVGYDDDENLAPTMIPGLTTIALPHRQIGEAAVQHVLGLVGGSRGPAATGGRVLLPCPAVVRESVGPPPRR